MSRRSAAAQRIDNLRARIQKEIADDTAQIVTLQASVDTKKRMIEHLGEIADAEPRVK